MLQWGTVYMDSTEEQNGETLKCYACATSNEEDCRKHRSSTCPQFADSCSIIPGSNEYSSVNKSCSYKAFCGQSQFASGGVNIDCCFTDDCNGLTKCKSASTSSNSASFSSTSSQS
ncbi:uncharacterized protein LOC144694749 [Cetorhinus maximus]